MHRISWLAPSLIIAALFSPALALADSVLWNTTFSGAAGVCLSGRDVCYVSGYHYALGFNNPNITIQYRAFIKNADTGEIIPPGSSVRVGTKLKLAFDKSVSSDIYWFETGAFLDSPYGDWQDPNAPPSIQCKDKDYIGTNPDINNPQYNSLYYDSYVPFLVGLPVESVSGADAPQLSCGPLNAGVQSCTAAQPGTVPLAFDFGPTFGKMYGRYVEVNGIGGPRGACTGVNDPMIFKSGGSWVTAGNSWLIFNNQPGATTDQINVPSQAIPYSITIVDAGSGSPPTNLTVSGGECTVGTQYTITMSSSDTDGDQVRYGIDWDADGSIDQFVPSSGYVDQGASQMASRTYATKGTKTIKVIAIDSHGLTSEWTRFTATCSGQQYQSDQQGQRDWQDQGQYSGTSASNVSPALSIHAIPFLVRAGDTTAISWSASNVSSCTVTSPTDLLANGTDPWAGTSSAGVVTSPIRSQTTYTLSCKGLDGSSTLTQSVTVNVVPSFQEQ